MKLHKSIFIVGGQRSGTSFLRDLLSQHTTISFAQPYNPEPKFFINHTNGTYRSFVSSYFPGVDSGIIIGEKSTSYFEFQDALNRISTEMHPELVIYIVRNPIDRAISNFKFSVKNKLETRSFKEVFDIEKQLPALQKKLSTNPFDYIGRSQISKIIPNLETVFGSKLHLIDFEKLILYPEEVANDVFKKLKIPSHPIHTDVDKNKSFSQIITSQERLFLNKKLSDEVAFYKSLQITNKI